MDAKNLTEEDINKFEQEIAKFEENRKTLLAVGISGIVGGFISLVLVIVLFMRQDIIYMTFVIFELLLYACIFIIFGGIACIILRTALYCKRINNRKNLIAEARRYQKDNSIINQ